MKNSFLLKIKLLIEFFFIYCIYLILSILPIKIVSDIGALLFSIIGPLTSTQNIVIKNLKHIFPNNNKSQIKINSKKAWQNTGRTFFELLILPKIIFSNKINIEGKENLKTILEQNERVIFIGIHQSNWEILLPSIDKLGISVGGIYRHINNPYINKLILKIRNKCILSKKSFYTPKGKQSAKDILEGINQNLSMILLIDQKDSAGENINFFDNPVKTQIGFIKIARKYKMNIIPVQNIREKNYFTLKIHKPINIESKNYLDKEIMAELHKLIEGWIEKDPINWFLQHNRFG